MAKKVVVAFSGGLDTSYTVMYLAKEKGYEVYAACANTGGFSKEQLEANERNAYKLGAVKYVTLDVTKEYYDKSLKYMVWGNVLRNGTYPVSVSSERIFQGMAIARYANEIGADAIAHGSTGAGNDQVRFDMTFLVMCPDIEIITLTRDGNLSRKEEVDYLNAHGYFADFTKLKYSYNVGIWGTSICGGEILDSTQGLPESAYLKQLSRHGSEILSLGFKKGELCSVNGKEYMADGFGLQPNFWRAPNDNDYGSQAPFRLQVWQKASTHFTVDQAEVNKVGDNVELRLGYALPTGQHYNVTYLIYPDGVMHLQCELTAADSKAQVADLPRLGMRFRLPTTLNKVEYLGRGPEENYWDRNAGSMVGRYTTSAEAMYVPYVRPQECGHRTDTRWVALTSAQGEGLLLVADNLMEFNALRNSVEDFDSENANRPYQWQNRSPEEIASKNAEEARYKLRKQTHINDIVERNYVEVCVDLRQQGVAGYNSWGCRTSPAYTLPADKAYEWGFTLLPISKSADIDKAIRYTY